MLITRRDYLKLRHVERALKESKIRIDNAVRIYGVRKRLEFVTDSVFEGHCREGFYLSALH